VTLVISALSFAGFYLSGYEAGRLYSNSLFFSLLLHQAWDILVYWNFVILIFNLIPLYPMDGGRIVHSLLWSFFSRRSGYVWGGQSRASQITLRISVVTAGAGILYAVHSKDQMLLFLFFWALLQALTLRQQGEGY
jgi:Zn-dependent protease